MKILGTRNLIIVAKDGTGHEVRLPAAELQLKAIDRLVKIVHRQSLLRGLDKPTQEDTEKPKSTLMPLDELTRRVNESQARREKMLGPTRSAAYGSRTPDHALPSHADDEANSLQTVTNPSYCLSE